VEVDPWVEEVRVALALNGGVSLAVWMGGCAVELDRARRTRCLRQPGAVAASAATERTAYGALCDAFRRELVIDVLSGSSAGGINGALLAGAQTNQRVLGVDFLRDRWLQLGDFSKLLHPLTKPKPASLMQGVYFAEQLERTFTELLTEAPLTDAPATVPALDITTTDVAGSPLMFRDIWGGTICAREYRARFRFRDATDFSAQNLAAAARASASFPLAFESYCVPPGTPRDLSGVGGEGWVVDGGLLDNAPIRAALSLIPTRPASRQVRRFLCYLNGDPNDGATDGPSAEGPGTRDVVGVVLTLPRKAPFADHLHALQDLARRSPLAHEAQMSLLGIELADLRTAAASLLPAYRHRRRFRALQDLLPEPGDAQLAFDALARAGMDLPWLPATLTTCAAAWPWGFQAARRVHHLAIDMVRSSLPTAVPEDRLRLLHARARIDNRLQDIEGRRKCFESDGPVQDALRDIVAGDDVGEQLGRLEEVLSDVPSVLAVGIWETALDLVGISDALGVQAGVPVGPCLFGEDVGTSQAPLSDRMFDAFLTRVVAVEVVRRSFSDDEPVDDGQEIGFAQMTPEAPAPIFTAHPVSAPLKLSAKVKLCGTILAHFGGFYRRSWRANDFMWGRLDAAARIVEMLVGAYRSSGVAATDEDQPWSHLAKQLAGGCTEQQAFLEEALADLPDPASDGSLEDRLHNVIALDLSAGDGRVTRMLCTRVVQFEILCDELPHLVREACDDEKLGSSAAALGLADFDLTTTAGVSLAVRQLRQNGISLAQALGRDSGAELTSDLAVRTIAHAGLVGLGVARQAGGRVAAPLMALRSALLPMAGAVSQHARDRLGVAAAFAAVSLYLGARVAATDPDSTVDAGALSTSGLLLTLVALLVVVGIASVPFARARWGKHGGRLSQSALCVTLLAVGGGGGAVAALIGPLTSAHLIIAPGVLPPWYVTWLPAALGVGAAVTGPRPLNPAVEEFTKPVWRGTWSLALTGLASLILALWAVCPLADAMTSNNLWRQFTAGFAVAAIPVALIVLVLAPARAAQPN